MGTPILRLVSGVDRIGGANYVPNPSFETSVGGNGTQSYTSANTIVQSQDQVHSGDSSCKITYVGTGAPLIETTPVNVVAGLSYMASAWVWIEAGWSGAAVGFVLSGFTDAVGSGVNVLWGPSDGYNKWFRVSRYLAGIGSDTVGSMQLNGVGGVAGEIIYTDDWQFEPTGISTITADVKAGLTDYLDGDQPGGEWVGPAHASPSTRSASQKEVVDLLGNTFFLNEVTPQISQYKDGGTFSSSPFADGRVLVDKKYANPIETYNLKAKSTDVDTISFKTQDALRLLIKATDYWTTDYQTEPVYLEARATNETKTRYALIHNGAIPELPNQWATPFVQPGGRVALDAISLIVERGHWSANIPGEGTPVELSAVEPYGDYGFQAAGPFEPTASADDGFIDSFLSTIDLTNQLSMGFNGSDLDDVGIRFRNVQIPKGSVITSAAVSVTASTSLSVVITNIEIFAEDVDSPAVLSTYADMFTRIVAPVTTANVDWDITSTWTADASYDTPDISAVIQEIIDRPGWAPGNDIMIFFWTFNSVGIGTRNMYSYNTGVGSNKEPKLNVTWSKSQADVSYGNVDSSGEREATTENTVFVANKRNMANITNIYVDDGGAWGINLSDSALPYTLLPAVPVVDDAVYFGINTALDNSGPFSSLVFDIGTVAAYGGAAASIWEFWNGATWATISTTDSTDGGSGSMDLDGVNIISFGSPTNWATRDISSDGGPAITGFFVRLRVTNAGTGITPPTQQNRKVYTVTWPYVEIQSDVISGDIDAIARWLVYNKSGTSGAILRGFDRLIIGSRLMSRGSDFTPAINCADEQNPPGITVAATGGSFVNAFASPTGRAIQVTGIIGSQIEQATITLNSILSSQYRGRFHLFVRGDYGTFGSGFEVSAQITTGSGGTTVTQTATTPALVSSAIELLDLGIVTILPSANAFDEIEIAIYAGGNSGSITMNFWDIWLMPVDEWSADIQDPSPIGASALYNGEYLEVDNISNPKVPTSFAKDVSSQRITSHYLEIYTNPPTVKPNERTRVYFLAADYTVATTYWAFTPHIVNSVTLEVAERYLSFRGNR